MAMATVAAALASALEKHRRGELALAESMYREVLAREPRHAQALGLLGTLALQTSRLDEAIALLERSVAIEKAVEPLCNLGSAYLKARRFQDALRVLDEAIRLDPRSAFAHLNRGLAQERLGQLDEAAAAYRRCLELHDTHVFALNNLGNVLRVQGRLDESLGYFERALSVDPSYARAHYNRSLVLLGLGRLAAGFDEYEWRLRCDAFRPRAFAQPTWDGSPLSDQTLLVYAEQGLGDTLQFVRYLPLVAGRCGRVIVEVPPVLIPLLEQSGFRGLVPRGAALPHFDVQISLASLARVFGTTPETIPADVPYLAASPMLVERWRARLAQYDGFKVGIAWQGSPTYREDRYRSIPLACFAPLAEVPGVRLFSLQKGLGVEQISALPGGLGIVDLGSQIDNLAGAFMDTAAIVRNLDLIVSSDTACAHLAGALNARAWIALGFSPDWRWLTRRTDSPWYPSLRLFRQTSFGDWSEVFRSMAVELARQLSAA